MAGPQFLWFLPLSHGKNAVALLVKKDSRLQLPPEHLLDVVHDFLSQEVILSYSCESYSAKRRPCGRPFVDASRCFTLTIWHSFWHIYPPFFILSLLSISGGAVQWYHILIPSSGPINILSYLPCRLVLARDLHGHPACGP